MLKKSNGTIGAVLFILGSMVVFINAVLQAGNVSAVFTGILTISTDILYILGALFLLMEFKTITEKLLMRDTKNKFMFGFGIYVISILLSMVSFFLKSSAASYNSSYLSVAIGTSLFLALVLIILALFHLGEVLKIRDFKIAAALFIVMVIVPPFTGADGMIFTHHNGIITPIPNIFIAAMYLLGTLFLLITSVLLLIGFKKIGQYLQLKQS